MTKTHTIILLLGILMIISTKSAQLVRMFQSWSVITSGYKQIALQESLFIRYYKIRAVHATQLAMTFIFYSVTHTMHLKSTLMFRPYAKTYV